MHKFRNVTEVVPNVPTPNDEMTEVQVQCGSNSSIANDEKSELTDLQVQWASNLSIASMIPNVTFLLLNAVLGHKFRAFPRLLAALVIIIVLFIFSDVMTKVNTDTWQYPFLGVTLFTVVIINIMVAIFQVR